MKVKLGLCQLKVGTDKRSNLTRSEDLLHRAAQQGADVVVFPEMFNCPYDARSLRSFAEPREDGETFRFLARAARENACYLVGGSTPEADGEHVYNTSLVFDRQGRNIAMHRKIHLFDVDVPGKITFRESALFKAGNQITSFATEFGRIGLAICYDIRFPELFRLLLNDKVEMVIVPAAFNAVTGRAHWQTLFRSRAIDNQVFMVGVNPSCDSVGSYTIHGHSLVVDPWGEIICDAGSEETVSVVTIDLSMIQKVRREFPCLTHRRSDLYRVVRPGQEKS